MGVQPCWEPATGRVIGFDNLYVPGRLGGRMPVSGYDESFSRSLEAGMSNSGHGCSRLSSAQDNVPAGRCAVRQDRWEDGTRVASLDATKEPAG